LEEGEFLFREGEESTEVFIVESGNLRVLKGDGDRQILLRTVGAGAMIGEIAFLTQSTRTASIVAAERTTLVALDLRQFRTYLERQPVWLRAMIDSLVRNVLDSDRAISTAAEAHVNERLQETFAAAEKNP
jgi:CRP-like cAMP-binding protein